MEFKDQGIYQFQVAFCKKDRYQGGGKVIKEPCDMYQLTLNVYPSQACRFVYCNFYLSKEANRFMLERFFESIGYNVEENTLDNLPWSHVEGAKGACRLKAKQWNGKTYWNVSWWFPKGESDLPAKLEYIRFPEELNLPKDYNTEPGVEWEIGSDELPF